MRVQAFLFYESIATNYIYYTVGKDDCDTQFLRQSIPTHDNLEPGWIKLVDHIRPA